MSNRDRYPWQAPVFGQKLQNYEYKRGAGIPYLVTEDYSCAIKPTGRLHTSATQLYGNRKPSTPWRRTGCFVISTIAGIVLLVGAAITLGIVFGVVYRNEDKRGNDGFTSKTPGIGGSCPNGSECEIPNSVCSDDGTESRCECSAGYVGSPGRTSCITLGSSCSTNDDCDMIPKIDCKTEETGARCLCSTGYFGEEGTTYCSLIISTQTSATSCSLAVRVSNLQQCLTDIKAAASNDSAFWFGTQYASFCPNGNPDPNGFDCFQPSNASNMFSRMFSPSFVPSSLDRFLTMEFTSPPGTYTGCGDSYTTNTTWKSDIDPLSSLVVKPWQVRFLPYLQWATLPGEMFTFVLYDVGYLNTHAIYTNVRGNDFSLADVTLKYNGPGNPGPRDNIYVFMIFRQSGHVTVPASWQTKMQRRINFTDFVTDWHLTGPVAINWLKVVGDVYAAQIAVNNHIVNMCPLFEETEINKMTLPSYLPKPVHINVGITVTYHSNAIDFTACCSIHKYSVLEKTHGFILFLHSSYTHRVNLEYCSNFNGRILPLATMEGRSRVSERQETFTLNPLRNPVYNTYKVSQKPTVTLLKKGWYPATTNFTGDMYTLMMVDANIVNPVAGNATHPLIFWLVTNIRDGNISTGQEYVSYLGPLPRNRSPHTYFYLLYKQQAALPASTFYSYTSHCANLLGRCLFNIDGLVAGKHLQLVGVTWLRASADIYVAFQRIYTAGSSVTQWCSGMQGYNGDPSCPTGLSTVVHPGVIVG